MPANELRPHGYWKLEASNYSMKTTDADGEAYAPGSSINAASITTYLLRYLPSLAKDDSLRWMIPRYYFFYFFFTFMHFDLTMASYVEVSIT